MGAEVEGQCKWYIWSNDVDLDQFSDTLWYGKEEAVMAARTSIIRSKVNWRGLSIAETPSGVLTNN